MKFKLAEMLERRQLSRFMDRMSGGSGTAGIRIIRPGVGDVTRLVALQGASQSLSDLPADPRTPTTAQ